MSEEPMHEQMDDAMYEEWLADRRSALPSPDLAERLMEAVEQRATRRIGAVRLADRMNESKLARFAACTTALAVGSLPFFFVAYVAELLVF